MSPMDRLIAWVLRSGLWFSVIIVTFGGIFYLLQNGSQEIHYQVLDKTQPAFSVLEMLREVWMFSPEGIISLGLFILVLTQVVRVALTVVIFVIEKDLSFVLISLFILAMLIYSIFWRS